MTLRIIRGIFYTQLPMVKIRIWMEMTENVCDCLLGSEKGVDVNGLFWKALQCDYSRAMCYTMKL